MREDETGRLKLIKEFFAICPDYSLCRTLVGNLNERTITYEHAIKLLRDKAADARLLGKAIKEQIDKKKILVQGKWLLVKDLSLSEIEGLDDSALEEVLNFYFKYPYAHERVPPASLLKPRVWRIRFLRALVEIAQRRNLDLDYYEWNELLSLI